MKKFYSLSIIVLLFNSLIIGQTRIYAPTLKAPENSAVSVNPNVTLDWDAVTGQSTNITYEVQLATQSDFSDAVTFPRTDVTAIQMNDLFFGENYFWHVKAYDDEDPSDWSETWSFTVLSSVNITKPDIGDEVYATTSIEWDAISGLSGYQLQIDTIYEWKNQDAITEENISGSFALGMDNLWLVGDAGLILHYDGTVWATMDAGITEDLKAIYFIDDMNGFAVGDGGVVLSYNGTDWTSVDVGTTNNLLSVSFSDADNGWIVGSSSTLIRYESGSWTVEPPSDIDNITDVFSLAPASVWICGDSKMVSHWDGSAWTTEVVGNKDHNSIWFTDENNGWVVSKGGKINYFNGNEWVDQTPSSFNKDLYSICFSGSTGYIVGKDGTMLNYIGGWHLVSSESTELLKTIYVNNGGGVLAGEGGSIVVKSNEGFTSPFLKMMNINFDSADMEVSKLLYGTKFYYRMRAMHSLDTTAWSGGRSMITYAAPDLSKPNNNANETDLDLTFKWDEYPGSSEYTIQISKTEDFSDPYISSSDSLSTYYVAKYFGQDYYWHVRASHSNDVSDWSETWKLTTINTVNLSIPDDNEIDVAFCPNYEWEEILGATGYEIWIDKNSDFSQPTVGTSNKPSFQCQSSLERNTKYYWKVRAFTSVDSSNWSSVRSFTVEGYAGIEDDFSSDYIDLYPNPTKNHVNLTLNSYVNDTYGISITDITGKMIYENKLACRIGENNFEISLPQLKKGLYLVNIIRQNKTVSKKLFID